MKNFVWALGAFANSRFDQERVDILALFHRKQAKSWGPEFFLVVHGTHRQLGLAPI